MGKVHQCENCNHVSELVEDFGNASRTGHRWLCRVCAATFLSRATSDSAVSVGEAFIMKSIAVLFNYLFDKLNIDQSELGYEPDLEEEDDGGKEKT